MTISMSFWWGGGSSVYALKSKFLQCLFKKKLFSSLLQKLAAKGKLLKVEELQVILFKRLIKYTNTKKYHRLQSPTQFFFKSQLITITKISWKPLRFCSHGVTIVWIVSTTSLAPCLWTAFAITCQMSKIHFVHWTVIAHLKPCVKHSDLRTWDLKTDHE